MRILKVEDGYGKYIGENGLYMSVKEIGKEDILRFLELIYNEDNIEMDQCSDTNVIKNPAENVIYQNLYNHLIKFANEKEILKGKISDEVNDAFVKYVD